MLADTTYPVRPAVTERARDSSPDVLEARSRARATQAGAAAARATRLPELRISTGIVDRGAPGETMKAEWQAGLGVSYPLYTGGQRGGQIERAEADARGAAQLLRLAEMAATQSVDRAIAAVTQAHARVAALRSAVEQSEAVAQVERTSLEVGSGTQTDYLDALAQLLEARSSLIDARHGEIAARIELARLTGELSPEWLARNLESGR